MNIDELAQHLQQLFSEKLKLNFGLDVFKDALGHLDQVEIEDLGAYAESLVKFSSDDSVIRKMLEAVCSEKECGAQLTELLQRWNGIFPDNPVPVPTPEVLANTNKGLVSATVVLGILSAALLATGIGYAVYKKDRGTLHFEDRFRDNVNTISVGTTTEGLGLGTSVGTATEGLGQDVGGIPKSQAFSGARKPLPKGAGTPHTVSFGFPAGANPNSVRDPLSEGAGTPHTVSFGRPADANPKSAQKPLSEGAGVSGATTNNPFESPASRLDGARVTQPESKKTR
ncbi:conserved hypothetical protein [Neorickettsia risticii str. Illinois]|uniref:Uncharacterized protein n=1 Tax=Neorickettsia risticii (strain Illinois) TaxID=434131 RepID=C6V3S1_NEORI|nr:hypothetical protein [Neorickettsia risticii]ACT69038.1 conserved hypothetical protein [Neorickettsia risticii str. Illinois]